MISPEALAPNLVDGSRSVGSILRTVVWGTLIAGLLDISAAMLSVQWRGIPAIQAVKGVAAGWLGADAFRGGAGVIALGFATHFMIMGVIVVVFCTGSRIYPELVKHWPWLGTVYGMAVYGVMTFIVVPASAFPGSLASTPAEIVQGVLVHIACVGLPVAFVAHRFTTLNAIH